MAKGTHRKIEDRIKAIDVKLVDSKNRYLKQTKELKEQKEKLMLDQNKEVFAMITKSGLSPEEIKQAIDHAKNKSN